MPGLPLKAEITNSICIMENGTSYPSSIRTALLTTDAAVARPKRPTDAKFVSVFTDCRGQD